MTRTHGIFLLLSAVACLVGLAHATAPAPVAPQALTAADIGGRLRVFARPGDYKLQNDAVTAVVRKRDGWLTELWRNHAILPTVEQLGTETEIDALWQCYPIVRVGKKNLAVKAARVAALSDGIEVQGKVDALGFSFLATTVYRLDPAKPRLRIKTTFREANGRAATGGVRLGDSLRWGNVQYYVDGVWPPRMKYKGRTGWIGRHGAGGDLLLRPVGKSAMFVDYGAKRRGFQGTITALYDDKGIPAGESVVVERELSFEPLPLPKHAKETTGTLIASSVDENGKPLPAKIRFDRAGSKKPPFDDDGGITGADRFAWSGNGTFRVELPVGRYDLLFTAGIERDASRQSVLIRAGKEARVDVRLPRVIPTPGWIAADLHLHQAPSVDADISLPSRVISIAAEGVELAVATDHYVVTDLGPTISLLKTAGVLSRDLRSIPGCEVSTLGNRFGHFNVFPLALSADVKSMSTTPSALFADARKKSPQGVLQVNHPRWDPALGYFTYYGIDDNTGEMRRAGYDPAYDTIEVYNGDDARDLKRVERVLEDFIHLLGRGRRYAATGSSDSHKLAFLDPGLPRTLVHWGSGSSDDADLKAPTKAVLAAIKAGNSQVTSGPILDVSVNGKGPGETAAGVGPKAKVHIVVRAAPWVNVRAVEVLVGGQGKRAHWIQVPAKSTVVRLDRVVTVPVKGKTFVIVTARGDRGLPNASREGTKPFAFTNPIWLSP